MTEKLPSPAFLVLDTTSPYRNLAVERALLDVVEPGELIMMLWRNDDTIVIGRNQNAWRECRHEEFERDGGRLARRFSGGGAVYHDLGNLNFSFVSRLADYDFATNVEIIRRAIGSFGLAVEATGRNDLTIDGSKFSGNAFFSNASARCHHGTLMLGVDMSRLARYLIPDKRKLEAKGIDSVRSRVVNLGDICPGITPESVEGAMIEALSQVCGSEARKLEPSRIDWERVAQLEEQLSSRAWKLGSSQRFTHSLENRFEWGGVQIELVVRAGDIVDAQVFSDAMDAEAIERVAQSLHGIAYSRDEMLRAIRSALLSDSGQMLHDLEKMVVEGMDGA
ncbi:MAG: lipoate--protein ligase [bacterium]|nr:lipoate--protein ligase [bacterium]